MYPTARYAWLTGRLHRDFSRVRNSGTWFQAAHEIASRHHDWEIKVRSLRSLGHVHMALGEYSEAHPFFATAMAIAQRRRLPNGEALAHHDLLDVAIATRNHARVAKESRLVATAYGADHPRLPHFRHDLAWYWMDCGDYERALDALLPLIDTPFSDEPGEMVLAAGSALRAAGGSADAGTFDRILTIFDDLRERAGASTFLPQALVAAARGAASLRRPSQAEELLIPAVELARASSQEDTELSAEALLARLPR